MKADQSDVDRGHAIYTKYTLAFYNWWVLGVSNRWLWECETRHVIDLYQQHITPKHLEVGVGTGFFPAKTLPVDPERLALVDINRHCLDYAGKRLAKFHPEIYQGNILEPVELKQGGFDSVALGYLLHCLPGILETKAGSVIDHLIPYLSDDGVIFGATLLGKEIERSLRARLAMALYNRWGILSNEQDSLGGLMEALSARFRTFNVEVQGCVVLFWGKGLREESREISVED